MTEAFPSRVQLQREDLGPIVNYVGIGIYDEARLYWQPDQLVVPAELYFADLPSIGRAVLSATHDALFSFIGKDDVAAQLDVNLLQTFTATRTANAPPGGRLTYERNYDRLLGESLSTGLIMPLVAYRMIKTGQRYFIDDEPDVLAEPLDLTDAITHLESLSFQSLMLRVANTRNGVYGPD